MNRHVLLACTLGTALGPAWCSEPLLAAEENGGKRAAATLDPVVVSATRTGNMLSATAASVSVVTRDDYEERQAGSVSDVLGTLPNVDFGGGPRQAGEIPSIRGFTGKEITLTIDGARQNGAAGITSPLYLDPYFLAGTEVMRGAASSLYGSGGLGGAMVFRTLSARDLLAPGQAAGGDARAGYTSADRSPHYNGRAYGQYGPLDALAAFGYAESGPIRQGGGTLLSPNDGHTGSGLFKLGLEPTGRLRFELSHLSYQSGTLRPNNPEADSSLGTSSTVPVQNNRVSQAQTVLKGTLKDTEGRPELDITLYRTRLNLSADANPSLRALPVTANVTTTTGASLQHSIALPGQVVGQRITYGLDYYRDEQYASSAGAANPVIPNGAQKVYGAFVQDEIRLGEPWRLTPSLRADRYDTDVGARSAADSHLSPKLTLAWQPAARGKLYASFGEAYRAPSISESFQNLSGRHYLFNFAANPDLKPETARTLELGGSLQGRDLLAAGDSARLRASVFQSWIKDLIASTVIGTYARTAPFAGVGTITQYRNVSNATSRGAEVEGLYQSGGLSFGAAYSRVRTTDDGNGGYLYSPPDKVVLTLRQALPRWRTTLGWTSSLVAAQDYDSTLLRRRPGYGVHSLYASWTPPGVKDRLRLDVGIENLFDKRYFPYQSGNAVAYTADTGRNFKIALSASF